MVNLSMIGAMILPNIGGWAGGFITVSQVRSPEGKSWYDNMKKPSWNPPKWVFGPAWTALYTSMGYASYKVYEDCGGFNEKSMVPLTLFASQLALNWSWTPIFFGLHKLGWAFVEIVVLDAAVLACTYSFYQVNKSTAFFMAPYLAWLGFASCLNYTIWKLNKDTKDIKDN